MSTLKSYQIQHLECKILNIEKQYLRLRELIELGDMQAIEQLSQLRNNIVHQQGRVNSFLQKFADTEIEVFLLGLATVLNSLLHGHQKMCTINEERTAVPWKRQAQGNHNKLNLSKKTTVSQRSDTSRNKSNNQSRSQLLKSASEKSMIAREKSKGTDSKKEQKKKLREQQNKSYQQQTFLKSAQKEKVKDSKCSKENKNPNQKRQRGNQTKPHFKSLDNTESLLTIKIGPQQFEQIIKLKNSMLTDFSFSS